MSPLCIYSHVDCHFTYFESRSNSLEVPQRTSLAMPRAARQLKTIGSESDSSSSTHPASRTPKDRSPKVIERRSPRSPMSELQKKRPNRVSELESQLAQLQEDLKKAKDQLNSSESWKRRVQQEAEEAKTQLLAMSTKLEESQQQILDLSASEDARVQELRKISQDRDRAWQSELDAVQKQHSVESSALTTAMNEIQRLKIQLEMVAESEAAQTKHAESARAEVQSLKLELVDSLSLLENMKTQLSDCKDSEAHAQAMVHNTLRELETAKTTMEMLRLDDLKAMEACNSLAPELEPMRAQVNSLEGLVHKLQADLVHARSKSSGDEHKVMQENKENGEIVELDQLRTELNSMKSEVGQLRSALDAAVIRYQEEHIQSTMQIRSAYELVELTKSQSCLREAELEEELKKTKSDIDGLKAKLMDKETELQSISEENERLKMKTEKDQSSQRESELEKELKKLRADVADLKANSMDKEMKLQSILEENMMLKLEMKKWEIERGKVNDEAVTEAEAARAAEREALIKLGYVMEEADKSSRKAARVGEQLEAAQATNAEMETELRRLKVQSDQWRKAAETAIAVLSTGNNDKFMEITGSLDSNYHHIFGKTSSPYSEDISDDSPKKKNGNMLKKIGVLWKKGLK
ncbi:hypothetical protein HHK36_016554 [Tetracentron sinense]|uniref:Interactor of constitutive active ROPs 3 n=1 Tax=Tetracentron sinense TaxID=13715 RepID=A0A834YXE5_TETSI|nr:hypothetical protein HHK36_016554 [Tetracentron sinense]